MSDVAVVVEPNTTGPSEAWSPEYAAYVLERVAPGHDWPAILVDAWVTSMMHSDALGTRPMWNSREALYLRSDVESLLRSRLGAGVSAEDVSRRIDAFMQADLTSDQDDDDDAGYGYAVKLDGDAADELLCQLNDLMKRQGETQGGVLAIAYALRLLADRSPSDDLRRLSSFAEQLCHDTATARVEVDKVVRALSDNQRLQRDRQRQRAVGESQ